MPKAKKPARTVTCGKCQEIGHNARTCSTTAKSAAVEATAEATKSSADVPSPPIRPETKPRVSPDRRMNTVPRRAAPTENVGATAGVSPYRCGKCNAVAILVVVRVKDHDASFKQKQEVFKGEMRCEACMNKPTPAELILKWGAAPGEKVPVPGQDDA